MKYVLMAIWIASSPHGPRWNEVAMQEFSSIETCKAAEMQLNIGHSESKRFDRKIETHCVKK